MSPYPSSLRTSTPSPDAILRTVLTLFLVAAPAAAGLGAGCSTTKGAAGDASRAAADVALPPPKEEKLGERFSQQIESEEKLHRDEKVQQYIRSLGQSAVRAAGDEVPKGIEFDFHVIDAPDTVNAFAGPGGQVYFYSGLLAEADNTAEVMGVMCHEVAHVTERHIAQRLVAQYGVQALAAAALGDDPGLVGQLAASIGAQGFLLKYSRDAERQADRSGFSYMTRTSYDPQGFVSFFERLQSKGGSPPPFLSSHPSPGERIENIRGLMQKRSDLPTETGEERHRAIVQRLGS